MLLLSFLFLNFIYASNWKTVLKSLKEPDSSVIYLRQTRILKEKNIEINSKAKIYYKKPYMIYQVSKPSQTIVFTPQKIYYFFHYLKKKDTSPGLEDVSPWEIFIENFKKGNVKVKKKKGFVILKKKKGENIYTLFIDDKERFIRYLKINTPFEKIKLEVLKIEKDNSLNKIFFKSFLKKELDKFR